MTPEGRWKAIRLRMGEALQIRPTAYRYRTQPLIWKRKKKDRQGCLVAKQVADFGQIDHLAATDMRMSHRRIGVVVDPVRDEVVGTAGPTTSSRMDKFSETMLGEAGLFGMISSPSGGLWPSRPSRTIRPPT